MPDTPHGHPLSVIRTCNIVLPGKTARMHPRRQHPCRISIARAAGTSSTILELSPEEHPVEVVGGATVTPAFSAGTVDRISELNAFAGQIAETGAVVEGPVDRPWNARDVVVHDPDGYRLVFTTPDVARMRDFEATIRGVRKDLAK